MEWQRDLSSTLMKIGEVRLDADDPKAALVAYEEALTIRRTLAAADPGNAQAQRDLGAMLHKFGDAQSDAGNHAAALAAYEESLAIRRRLAALDPDAAGMAGRSRSRPLQHQHGRSAARACLAS